MKESYPRLRKCWMICIQGYIGDSTRSEIEYAEMLGKEVKYLEP